MRKGPAFAKAALFLLLPALLMMAGERSAYPFHQGGVGACEGCHTMHNSAEGMSMSADGLRYQTAAFLLRGRDVSSTCLHCHQQAGTPGPSSYRVSTPDAEMPTGVPPKQLGPAGDFGWLKKTFSWAPAMGDPLKYSYGDNHGHNIVSYEYGYYPDPVNASAPGGSYPSANLSCTSCHDPHGSYRRNGDGSVHRSGPPIQSSGSYSTSPSPTASASVGTYRLLGGTGYYPRSGNAALAFVSPPPAAVAPENYNRAEELSATRVAYGLGMSEWCQNCHADIHERNDQPIPMHPYGEAGGRLDPNHIDSYNRYVKTGDLSGFAASSYLSLVPFEAGTGSYAVLKDIVINAPAGGPNESQGRPAVMCLSCHRAHASGWDEATRWNTRTENMVTNGKYSQEGEIYQPYGQGRSEMEARRAYYETPASKFADIQKSLCSKCHSYD